MEQILPSTISEEELTHSDLPEDIYRHLGTSEIQIKAATQIVPKHYFFIDDEWEWALPYSDTTAFEAGYIELDEIDFIESPLMPPKKRFKVILKVQSIKKGQPSHIDDIEI